MAPEFEVIKMFEGQRVPMHFDEAHERVARLLPATQDSSRSQPLIYDAADPTGRRDTRSRTSTTYSYPRAETLFRIEPAGAPHAGTA